MCHHSEENGVQGAAWVRSAPLTHPAPPERSTAHRGTSHAQPARWHWTDVAMIACAAAGIVLMIATTIWALTLPSLSMHYDSAPANGRPADLGLPGPPVHTPIPMVIAQQDDPRAVVWVPAPMAVAR